MYKIQEKFLNDAIKIAENNSVTYEPFGIAGLELMLQLTNKLPKNKKILIVKTRKSKFK